MWRGLCESSLHWDRDESPIPLFFHGFCTFFVLGKQIRPYEINNLVFRFSFVIKICSEAGKLTLVWHQARA